MTQTIKVAPPNSFVLICDAQGGIVPDPDAIAEAASISATNSCVTVCCLAEMDGETEIKLGPADEVGPESRPAFEGAIETPTHTVAVFTTEWTKLLQINVMSDRSHLKIWTNRKTEPDKIAIGVGSDRSFGS